MVSAKTCEIADLMGKAEHTRREEQSHLYSEALRLVSSLQTEETCKDALLNIANFIEKATQGAHKDISHEQLLLSVSNNNIASNTDRVGKGETNVSVDLAGGPKTLTHKKRSQFITGPDLGTDGGKSTCASG